MPTSKPLITLSDTEWVLLSEVAATIQCRRGHAVIRFADELPIDIDASGKILDDKGNAEVSFGDDAKCYGIASKTTKTAIIAVTEH